MRRSPLGTLSASTEAQYLGAQTHFGIQVGILFDLSQSLVFFVRKSNVT
jgi:hypothetical protein